MEDLSWEGREGGPFFRVDHVAVVHEEQCYIFAGYDCVKKAMVDELWRLPLPGDTPPPPPPSFL